jgi:hypothetical protein
MLTYRVAERAASAWWVCCSVFIESSSNDELTHI